MTYYNESYTVYLMQAILEVRKERHVSQRALAARAKMSFRGLQLLEKDGHDWRAGTMARVAEALNLPGAGVDLAVGRFLRTVPNSIGDVTVRTILCGFESWKTHLFDFVDSFRARPAPELLDPPMEGLDPRLHALWASVVEALCAEKSLRAPAWCRGVPSLDHPWFVAGVENLKATALVESPVWFRARNIFVLGNFLDRV